MCSHPCPFHLSVWYISRKTEKNTEHISMKLGWKMDLRPEQNLLTFSADPDKGMDQGKRVNLAKVLSWDGIQPEQRTQTETV